VTYLIGASILLILASAVSLVMGWVGANENLIWFSILASVVSAVCLALAYFRSRHPRGSVTPPPTKK
jgi:hypothetical protein